MAAFLALARFSHSFAGRTRRIPSALLAMSVGTGSQSVASKRFWLAATAGTAALVAAGMGDSEVVAEAANDYREEETDIGFSRTLQIKVRVPSLSHLMRGNASELTRGMSLAAVA